MQRIWEYKWRNMLLCRTMLIYTLIDKSANWFKLVNCSTWTKLVDCCSVLNQAGGLFLGVGPSWSSAWQSCRILSRSCNNFILYKVIGSTRDARADRLFLSVGPASRKGFLVSQGWRSSCFTCSMMRQVIRGSSLSRLPHTTSGRT